MYENLVVLIVDDEEKARLYLASLVSELYPELSIHFAATPTEAMFLLEKSRIDVVLLDVEMPGMTGLEMLERLRKIDANLPVIFVSAYKRAEFIQKAIRLRATDYIDKPVNPFDLENALSKALTQNSNRNKLSEENKVKSDRFCILTDYGEMFVEVDDVLYFSSLKRYAVAHLTDGETKVVRENLESLSKKLTHKCFLRVSRQYIVNLSAVKFVSKSNKTITLFGSESQVILEKISPNIISCLLEEFKL